MITAPDIAFFVFATAAVAGGLGAVMLRNVTYALLSLVIVFFAIAGLFFSMHADFLGAVQILVYVGAVAVLVVFTIVLTRTEGTAPKVKLGARWLSAALAAIAGATIVYAIMQSPQANRESPNFVNGGDVEQLGTSLMTTFALPFEVASILLTAALIGAVVIALDEVRKRVPAAPDHKGPGHKDGAA